jgi:hypothetical protein
MSSFSEHEPTSAPVPPFSKADSKFQLGNYPPALIAKSYLITELGLDAFVRMETRVRNATFQLDRADAD